MNFIRNKDYFQWKHMEQVEKFVKHYIKRNSSFWLSEVKR